MTKTDQYRQTLNQLEQQLTPNDAQYFQALRHYLLTKNLFKNNEATLTLQLLTMLQDFLDASQHGETAIEFFGEHPTELADNILAELPQNNRWQQLKLISELVLISWFFILMNAGTADGIQLNWLLFLIIPLIEISAVLLMFKIMNRALRTTIKSLKHTIVPGLVITTLALILIIALMLNATHLGHWSFVTIPNPWGMMIQIGQLLVTLGWLGYSWLIHRHRSNS